LLLASVTVLNPGMACCFEKIGEDQLGHN